MLLLEVAVEGSFAGDGSGHVDGVGGGGFDDRAAGFVDADEGDGGGFAVGGVGEVEDGELTRGGVGLDADDDVVDALAGAVGVHAVDGLGALDDGGLVGEGGCGGGLREGGQGEKDEQTQEAEVAHRPLVYRRCTGMEI